MKGMMNFLERTGFVRSTQGDGVNAPDSAQAPPSETQPEPAPVAPVEQQLLLSLPQIYAQAGVSASNFPAEKLQRLLAGLQTMDEGTRRTAVQAMDAADDAWTIEDPIRDAMAKVQALNEYSAGLRAGVEQAEREGAALLSQVKEREAATVADIRRQISELDALLTREIARSAQEQAAVQADLQAKRDGAARQIDQLGRTTAELRQLITQFGSASGAAPDSATTA